MNEEFLNKTYFNNSVEDYLFCLSIIFIAMIIVKIIEKVVIFQLKRLAKKTETTLDDFLIENLDKTATPVLNFGAIYIGINNLHLTDIALKILHALGSIVVTYHIIKFIISLLVHLLEIYWIKKDEDHAREKSLKGLVIIAKTILWSAGLIFLLDNLGFEISTVIAGLGVGGVAIALAAQTVLSDLFCYIAILFDRPFEVGDFIIVDDKMGNVEHIGVKTTRITSLTGEQLIFANTDLTQARIQNYKRMQRRRIAFSVGVVYQTSAEKLRKIPSIIETVVKGVENVDFDRCHFSSFGDSSLNFETVYYVRNGDYRTFMDVQEEINLKIFEEFEKEGLDFAYPTQTLFVEK